MAVINKTGITTNSTIQAEHVTRAIDALSGVSTSTIIATGSFSGSLNGAVTISAPSTLNGFDIVGGASGGAGGIDMTAATKNTGFRLPSNTNGAAAAAGNIYWDDATGTLYVYQASTTTWLSVQLT